MADSISDQAMTLLGGTGSLSDRMMVWIVTQPGGNVAGSLTTKLIGAGKFTLGDKERYAPWVVEPPP